MPRLSREGEPLQLELVDTSPVAPWFHNMAQAVGKDSLAASPEELLRPLVSALPRFALLVLAQVLQALCEGVPSRLLLAVLHLCQRPWHLVRASMAAGT